jgi:hypothetical protein
MARMTAPVTIRVGVARNPVDWLGRFIGTARTANTLAGGSSGLSSIESTVTVISDAPGVSILVADRKRARYVVTTY